LQSFIIEKKQKITISVPFRRARIMSTKPSSASSPAKPSPSPSLLPQWILPAALSGLCAAANGVFAKLVTTQLTTSWAGILTDVVLNLVGKLPQEEGSLGAWLTPENIGLGVEVVIRGVS
jgi:hypothetical protein